MLQLGLDVGIPEPQLWVSVSRLYGRFKLWTGI